MTLRAHARVSVNLTERRLQAQDSRNKAAAMCFQSLILTTLLVIHFPFFRGMQLLSKNEALEKEQCAVHAGFHCRNASHGQGEQCRIGT